jgi:hypothetical protein
MNLKSTKESEILQRRNNEKISLRQIRKYNNYIVENRETIERKSLMQKLN